MVRQKIDTGKPRHFYGWVMAGIASAAMVATSPGQTYLVSMFYSSISESIRIDATTIGTAYMIATLCATLPMTWIGRVSDRIGPRAAMAAASLGLAFACWFIGTIDSVFGLTLSFFFLRLFGQGALSLTSGHTLALWFRRRLGTAEAIRHTCFGIAVAVIPSVAVALIDHHGWRTAYMIFGAGSVALVWPLVLFFYRSQPEALGQRVDGVLQENGESAAIDKHQAGKSSTGEREERSMSLHEAIRTRAYWVLVAGAAFNGMVGTAIVFHLQPIAARGDASHGAAAVALVTYAAVSTTCTLFGGFFVDRFRERVVVPVLAGAVGLASVVLALSGGIGALHLSLGLAALGVGTGYVTFGTALARFFGTAHHGAIRGSLATSVAIGTGVGPFLLGLSSEIFGTLSAGLWFFALLGAGVTVFALGLRAPRSG